MNPPSLNMLYFQGSYLTLAVKTGIVTGILALTVSIIQKFNLREGNKTAFMKFSHFSDKSIIFHRKELLLEEPLLLSRTTKLMETRR